MVWNRTTTVMISNGTTLSFLVATTTVCAMNEPIDIGNKVLAQSAWVSVSGSHETLTACSKEVVIPKVDADEVLTDASCSVGDVTRNRRIHGLACGRCAFDDDETDVIIDGEGRDLSRLYPGGEMTKESESDNECVSSCADATANVSVLPNVRNHNVCPK